MAEEIKTIEYLIQKTDRIAALAGNPNTGKSSIFNCLTGQDVFTANYSGKTVDLNCGILNAGDKKIGIVDLPGVYSLGALSDEQKTAIKCLFENKFDNVIYVADATNLSRNLYLLLQLAELGLPITAALNFSDIANNKGLKTDTEKLERLTGIHFIETSALRGEGIEDIVKILSENNASAVSSRKWKYTKKLENALSEMKVKIAEAKPEFKIPSDPENLAPAIFEHLGYIEPLIEGTEIEKARKDIFDRYSPDDDEKPDKDIISQRYAAAGRITAEAQTSQKRKAAFSDTLWSLSTNPVTGLPILLAIAAAVIIILFQGGEFLSGALEDIWKACCEAPMQAIIHMVAGTGIAAKVLNWGFNDGLLAAISVGIPYVLIFYIILSFLEDSGYLNAAAFLLDKILHFLGLHSKAFIPISAAIGCSVPAVMGTRILTTKREKIISIALIALIACSARTAVIFGAVSKYIGIMWAVSIIVINALISAGAGLILNKIAPGKHQGTVMEIFPLRMPRFKTVMKKTWSRFKEFMIIAMPIVIAGSMGIGWLYETNIIWLLEKPFAPLFEGWLGLPAFTALVLFFAVLRKELALQFLVVLAAVHNPSAGENLNSILTNEQIYTFTVFNTMYMPCIATIGVMIKEAGLKWTAAILIGTLMFTFIFTGLLHHIITLFHLL